MEKIKKARKQIIFVAIGGLIFYILFILLGDVKKLSLVFSSFNFRLIPILFFLTILNYFIRFLRWHFLLIEQSIKVPFLLSLQMFLAGISMTITPGKMGEVVKSYALKKFYKVNYSKSAPVIVFERLTDGIAMMILSLGGISLFKQVQKVYIIAFIVVCSFITMVFFHKHIIKLLNEISKRFSYSVINKFIHALDSFLISSKGLFTYRIILISVFIGIIAWICEGTALFLILREFYAGDVHTVFMISLFLFSFSSILGFLVMVPGGIGVAEGSISALLVWALKLPLPQSVFIALIFRFTSLWFGVFFSFPFFFRIIRRPQI